MFGTKRDLLQFSSHLGEKSLDWSGGGTRGMFVTSRNDDDRKRIINENLKDKDDDRERIIDENLKKVFNETLDEGIPDRFKDLLSKLKKQDVEQGSEK